MLMGSDILREGFSTVQFNSSVPSFSKSVLKREPLNNFPMIILYIIKSNIKVLILKSIIVNCFLFIGVLVVGTCSCVLIYK